MPDRYAESKPMTNPKRKREDWPPKMVVCVGTVVLREKRALLIRQAAGHSLAGRWSIPWGIVDPEEAPEIAALRETREESGITAEIEGLMGIQNLRPQGWVSMIFLCRHVSGVPTSNGGIETDQAAYFSLQELAALKEPVEPWCEWLVRRVLHGEYCSIPPEVNNPFQPLLAFL